MYKKDKYSRIKLDKRIYIMSDKADGEGTEMDLKGRDFLKLLDFEAEEIDYLLDLAAEFKEKRKKGF